MWSIIAASVVLLPEPVVPVTRMIPRCSSASLRTTWRQPEILDRADLEGDRAADDRDRAALLEGVDAEAGEAGDRVGEVGLAVLLELGQRARLGDVVEGLLGVLGAQRADSPRGATSSPCMRAIGGDADLDVKVGPLPLDERAQALSRCRTSRPVSAGMLSTRT